MLKKFLVSDLGLKMDGLNDEQKSFMSNVANVVCEVLNKALDGALSPSEIEEKFNTINKSLPDKVEYDQLKKDNEEMWREIISLKRQIGGYKAANDRYRKDLEKCKKEAQEEVGRIKAYAKEADEMNEKKAAVLYDYLDNLELLGKRSNRKHILLNLLYIPFI